MKITLSHKIALEPNYKQEQYFKQACGIARFTWNWALEEWNRQYKSGLKPKAFDLKKSFNARKPIEFSWMYEVTKYASQQPFIFKRRSSVSSKVILVILSSRKKVTMTAFILVMTTLSLTER